MAGQLKVNEFVSHTLTLDKINEAFDLMHSGERLVSHLLQNSLMILLILLYIKETGVTTRHK